MPRVPVAFGALVMVQAAHSIEEYMGRLWESFPPAAFLSGLVSPSRELGFVAINVALLAFGFWCLVWPIRHTWRSSAMLAWFWVVIELVNGIGHPVWSVWRGGYTPGVITAPVLLLVALYLAFQLRHDRSSVAPAA
jgi:hypothetical protein